MMMNGLSGLQNTTFFLSISRSVMADLFLRFLVSGAKMSSPLVAQLRRVIRPRSSHDHISVDEFLRKISDLLADEMLWLARLADSGQPRSGWAQPTVTQIL